MSIVLEEKYKQIVIKILSEVLNSNTRAYVFGSRVKGTKKPYADLDIAIKGEVTQSILDKLRINFENSLLPIKVDIVDLNNIDKDFYNNIKNDLEPIL